jgi:PKD repeat protein
MVGVGRWRGLIPLLAAFASLASLSGCDKVPLLAPTNTTITLFVTDRVLPVNGTTEVIANVIEAAGTPVHNGTVVTFTTNLGRIDPREARTEGGRVTARLQADGISGTARVGAISGSSRATEVEVVIGAAAATRVILNVSPGTVPAGGGTVEVVALVTDANGNRLLGVPVIFTATAGRLLAGTVLTDGSGEARTTLTTNRETTITASAGNQQQSVTVRVNLAPTIAIAPTTTTPVEEQPTNFTVTVTPVTGGSAVQHVQVDFGDGQSQSLGALTGSTTVAHVYRRQGTYAVSATVTDVNGDSNTVTTTIVVGPAPPVNVTLTAAPTNPQVNTAVTLTATVTPATTQVRAYEWSFGDGTRASTTGNVTSHVYTTTGRRVIRVTVFADTNIGEAQAEIIVVAVPTTPTTPSIPAPVPMAR